MRTQPQTIIQRLEADNSRLAKEVILQTAADENLTEFFEGLRMALDNLYTFGVKQVPTKEEDAGQGLSWDNFLELADSLYRRRLTGHAARDAINLAMNVATKEQWNDWYRRILIKDLRCGVSEKTINKVVEKDHAEYSIPIFSCQLAHDSANHESKVSGRKLIEVKLDGVRVITVVYPDGRVDQYSRNGKELVNFPHLKDQLSKIASGFTEPMVLDGEVMSTSFQDLMKQVHRKSDVNAKDALLYLFDAVPLKDFETGKCKTTQKARSQWLKDWYNGNIEALPNFRTLAQELVDLDTEAGQKRFRAINQSAIDGGYEGIMIKDIYAPYEVKRRVAWLKLKPFIEVSLEVTDVEEGTGKNVGRLGALVCSGRDDGRDITVNVGSGFTDDNRVEFWSSRSELPGNVVEVRADAITKNQDGTYSLRFPRFLRFRGFEVGEKI